MASYLRPRRGKKATAEAQLTASAPLKRGEVFFEVPDTGVGTGAGKIKMGDGSTAYSSLPYFLESFNPDTGLISFTDSTAAESDPYTTNATHANAIVPTANLKTIFTNLKQLLLNYNSQLTSLNNELDGGAGDPYAMVFSKDPRFIHGYESLVSSILPDFTDTNISNLTSIHVDECKVRVGSKIVKVEAQNVNVTGSIGNNFYVYVNNSGNVSVSTTDTADGDNSTKIGGFHYGRVRKSTTAENVTAGVVPNSIWTLKWRPSCKNPNAMVYMGNKLWGDIYLTRSKSSAASNGIGGIVYDSSAYGALPATGTEGYNQYGFTEALAKVGKRLAFNEEIVWAGEGSPNGQDGNNTYAWTKTSNSARTTCGNVAYAISSLNICDLVGNVWKWNADKYELNNGGTSYSWHTSTTGRGDIYGPGNYGLGALISGGDWTDGAHCGSRCASVYDWPWNVDSDIGCWAVSSSI